MPLLEDMGQLEGLPERIAGAVSEIYVDVLLVNGQEREKLRHKMHLELFGNKLEDSGNRRPISRELASEVIHQCVARVVGIDYEDGSSISDLVDKDALVDALDSCELLELVAFAAMRGQVPTKFQSD